MELDAWREDGADAAQAAGAQAEVGLQSRSQDGWDWDATAAPDHGDADAEERWRRPAPAGRSACWEALLVQQKAAKASNAFVFSDRKLDGVGAIELTSYLREQCQAKFVDLSRLGRWPDIAVLAADALRHGLRATRSLVLDGNDVGGDPQVLESWCSALEEHPGLQHLSLRDARLADASVARLAQALRGHSVLFSVDLGMNRIGDAGVESLTGALTENTVLLEVNLEGVDAGEGTRKALQGVLERNRARYGGVGGCARMLQVLRRARAEAATALDHSAARTPAVAGPLTRQGDIAPCFDASAMHLSTAVEVEDGSYVWLPLAPSIEQALEVEGRSVADEIFFDAGDGVTQELNCRCEAGWRYTAADAERLNELRRTIADAKAERRQERDRFEEVMRRIEDAQRIFTKRTMPMQDQIISGKEQLAEEIDSTKGVLQERIQLNLLLKAAEEELEDAREDNHHSAMNAQALDHSLKLRHREVDEEAQKIRADMLLCEEATEKLERENEMFRRRLHAARFETEEERFVPRWTPAERAAMGGTLGPPEAGSLGSATPSLATCMSSPASPCGLLSAAVTAAYPAGQGSTALGAIDFGPRELARQLPSLAGMGSALAAIGQLEHVEVGVQRQPPLMKPLPPPGHPPSRSLARPTPGRAR